MKERIKPIRVATSVKMEEKNPHFGIALELLLLLIGMVGYLFCNTTALDMNIPAPIVLLIAVLALALMILLVWYKRVFFGVLGGFAGLSLLAFPISFPLFRSLWRSLVVCYNYTVYLLASQPNYSDYKDHLTMDIETVIATPMILQRHFYTAVILVAIVAAIFFALAFFRRIPPILAFLVPMAGLIPFFLYGIVPHYVAFSVLLSALIGCYGQSAIKQMTKIKKPKVKKTKVKKAKGQKAPKPKKETLTNAQRLQFAARSGSFGIVVTAMMLLITMGTATLIYAAPIIEMETVREGIDMMAEDAMNLVFAETYEKNLNVGGYMEEGEHLGLEVPRWRRLKVATVYSVTDTPVYLRFRTAVDLSEDGWTMPDEDFNAVLNERVDPSFCEYTQFYEYISLTTGTDPLQSELDAIESEELGYVKDTITVKPKYKVSNVLGIPGGAVELSPSSKYNDLERMGDTVLVHHDSPRDRSYTYQVVSPLFTNDAFLGTFQKTQAAYMQYRARYYTKDSFLNNELAYSNFVRARYTAINGELEQLVRPLALEISGKYNNKLEKVQSVERFFREEFTYSTVRNRLVRADGTPATAYDQVNYFLFQNKEKSGYCTLFASSMVSMLRSMNIPARVVSGYYVTPMFIDLDEYGSEINDSSYHSWVEVYFDGIGWVSFEPTPGFGVDRNYYLLDLADQGLESEYADQEVILKEEEIEGVIIYTDVLPEPTLPEEEKELEQMDPSLLFGQTNPWVKIVLTIGGALLLLALAIFGILWNRRTALHRIKALPPAEGVRAAYDILLHLMQLRGFKFFEGELLESFAQRVDNLGLTPLPMKPILPILQKALYSDLELEQQERAQVADFVLSADKAFIRSNPIKAVWYCLTLRTKPRHQKMIWKFQ